MLKVNSRKKQMTAKASPAPLSALQEIRKQYTAEERRRFADMLWALANLIKG